MSKKRVLFIFVLVIAAVFYFSWLPDPSFKDQVYLPRWILKWSDHYYNLRTAIPFLAVGFLLEAYSLDKSSNEIKNSKNLNLFKTLELQQLSFVLPKEGNF